MRQESRIRNFVLLINTGLTGKFQPTRTRKFILCFLVTLCCLALPFQALGDEEAQATLRRFLSARMFGEAYMELLRLDLIKDEINPALQKLRADLIPRTRERLERQGKINSDDPAIFTILADISFHEGKLDEAVKHITTAMRNGAGPMANYIFAKVLFRRGNLDQAFDQMGIVLEHMADSEVIFNDFQFLYSCKSFGIPTARQISPNTNFLKRATPVMGEHLLPKVPETPFENDPTQIANLPDPQPQPAPQPEPDEADDYFPPDADMPDLDPDDDPLGLDDLDDDYVDLPDLPDLPDVDDPLLDDLDQPPRPVPIVEPAQNRPVITATTTDTDTDPEQDKIQRAEYRMNIAQNQFKNRNYDESLSSLRRALEIYPQIAGGDELQAKLDAKFDLYDRYKISKGLFDEEKYDLALPTIIEIWEEEPERFPQAAFQAGKCYLLKDKPDQKQALKYFSIVLENPHIDPNFRRDLDWTILEILYDTSQYQDALKKLNYFIENENDFAKNQKRYLEFKYGIWFQLNKVYVFAAIGSFALMFFIVFMLRLLPAISFSFSDPLTSAKKAYTKGNYDKAIKIVAKALEKKQPIQVEREMLELCVKSHYELKNYVRCQENARQLLTQFHDNQVAWAYLAKASLESNDTSNQAINMYEGLFRENPDNSEYLPVLARHYAETKNYSVEAMEILFTYFQLGPKEPTIILALAEGYVQSKAMGQEVITILEEACIHDDRPEFRELLARNYAKSSRYADAARECLKVLENNINNMGIHVVYSSSMKKLNMIEEAITQYEVFLKNNPDNPQLKEILSGLHKDAALAIDDDGGDGLLPELPDELPLPDFSDLDMPEPELSPEDIDIDSFVEPPPDGYEEPQQPQEIPLPDFLKADNGDSIEPEMPAFNLENLELVDPDDLPQPGDEQPGVEPDADFDIPTLDPFEDSDELFDEFAGDLPEELGGEVSSPAPEPIAPEPVMVEPEPPSPPVPVPAPEPAAATNRAEIQAGIKAATEKLNQKKFDEVIEILSPLFASERNRDIGLLLVTAWLGKSDPLMAMEIIETLDIDPEIMPENIKDVFYRTGIALENAKKFTEALRMYDMICNVDINYKDAFDRSDKLYSKKTP